MDIIVLIGSGAVGKMTVGQELMKITDFRLFHNHMMIEPVIEIFGHFNGALVSKLREDIFDAFMKTDYCGMIFTYMWAFDLQSDWDYLKSVTDKFEATGGTSYYVELVADQSVRLERNKTENRLRNKASKRDIIISQDRLIREETSHRLVSNNGEIPFKNYIKIDNTHLEPSEVALMIKKRFNLPDKSSKEMMKRILLTEVRDDEFPQLYEMQKESFMSLCQKYQYEIFPVIEMMENSPNISKKYYFIIKDGAIVGSINIGKEPENFVFFICSIFVTPNYQNQGIASIAIKKAFKLHPEAKHWRLKSILEEKKACHLFEKIGFVQTGEKQVINEKITLINYELVI